MYDKSQYLQGSNLSVIQMDTSLDVNSIRPGTEREESQSRVLIENMVSFGTEDNITNSATLGSEGATYLQSDQLIVAK